MICLVIYSRKAERPMSDFLVIAELFTEIVTFLFKRTVDVVCTAMLIVSMALPWRIMLIVEHFRKIHSHEGDYWELCFLSFFCTLLDVIVIPLTLVALISPNWWEYLARSIGDFSSNSSSDDQSEREFKLRARCCQAFAGAILDFIMLPFGLLLVLWPMTLRIVAAR